jgi:hypothetical protein
VSAVAREPAPHAANVAQFFASAVLRDLARRGRSARFAHISEQAAVASHLSPQAQVRDVFDLALTWLEQQTERSAYPYRVAVARKLFRERHKVETATLLPEFRVGACRADAVVLNGKATAYEIKSERDNLGRLREQLDQYARVFPIVTVVAAPRHVEAVAKIAAASVGILVLSEDLEIETYRAATSDPGRLSVAHIFDCLQRAEAIAVLKKHDIAIPELPNTEMYGALRRLFETLTPAQAHAGMLATLKKTRSLKRHARSLDQLPASLYAAALSMPFHASELTRLVAAMDITNDEASRWT